MDEIIAGQQTQLELAQSRHQWGATDELDIQRARSELRNSQAKFSALEGESALLTSRIAVLSGRFPGELDIAAVDGTDIGAAKPVSIGSPNFVLSQRPVARPRRASRRPWSGRRQRGPICFRA